MSFNVQDDLGGTASANAYISVAFFSAYHADRLHDLGDTVQADHQAAIIKASDFIDRRYRGAFIGIRYSMTQTTEWPRINANYQDGRIVSGIPIEVKQACAELAFRALTAPLAPDPVFEDTNRIVASKTERVGPIEESTSYVDSGGAIVDWRPYPEVEGILRELVHEGRTLLRA